MVLRDIDPPPNSFNDNPYPSDGDSYSNHSPERPFDLSTLPQPIPIIGPFIGFSQAAVRYKIEVSIKFAEQTVRRRMTADEKQAWAMQMAQFEQTKSYFTAGGVALGGLRWYQTMAKCRFPFYQPKPEDIDPNKFAFIKGPLAQQARHSWRLSLYASLVGLVGYTLGQMVGQPLAAHGASQDPRMAQFSEDLRAVMANDAKSAQERFAHGRKEWAERIAREREAKSREGMGGSDASARKPWGMRNSTSVEDDMSPTAGDEPWSSTSENPGDDSAFAPEPAPTSTTTPQRREQPPQPTRTWGGDPSQRVAYGNDDASPTGGMFQDEVKSQGQEGGSAWDRLRRGQAPQPIQYPPPQARRQGPPPRGQTKEDAPSSDSFAFAGTEEERRRAQGRAQREFDARVEQERRGKDFDEKRW